MQRYSGKFTGYKNAISLIENAKIGISSQLSLLFFAALSMRRNLDGSSLISQSLVFLKATS